MIDPGVLFVLAWVGYAKAILSGLGRQSLVARAEPAPTGQKKRTWIGRYTVTKTHVKYTS